MRGSSCPGKASIIICVIPRSSLLQLALAAEWRDVQGPRGFCVRDHWHDVYPLVVEVQHGVRACLEHAAHREVVDAIALCIPAVVVVPCYVQWDHLREALQQLQQRLVVEREVVHPGGRGQHRVVRRDDAAPVQSICV